MFHPFRPQSERKERRPGWLHLLVAQSFPGDAAEEGMTLDVTHTSTAGAQPVAGVKLEQLWSGILFTGRHCNIILCRACVVVYMLGTQASGLTSVSRDAAAVLRWSGMSSWVWEWIPAGWSCHSGWRHSEQNVKTAVSQWHSFTIYYNLL